MTRVLALVLSVGMVACTGTSPATRNRTPTAADQEQVTSAMCEKTLCQRNVRIRLKKKDGSVYDRTFDVLPGIVQPLGITVLAGQTVNIEAEIQDGKLTNLTAVDVVANPQRTITATLTQLDSGGMMLAVSNPFTTALKFNMAIMPLDKEDHYKTSSCPARGNRSSFEGWPEPLFQVLLMNARFVGAESGVSCEY